MEKDNAPAIGGAGGGILAWLQNHIFLSIVPPFVAELLQVAIYAFVGAAIGEGVKTGYAWLKTKWKNK